MKGGVIGTLLLPFAVSLLILAGAKPAPAFGILGHQVVAGLAEDLLTPKAEAEVRKLLGPAGGSVSLVPIATWADEIRTLRPETRPWHYVTLQLDEAGYDSAHADPADAVKALKRQSAILADPGADRYAREEALKWVVHLVGDLHQPLHAGEDHDKGGNLAKVKVNRRTYSLHQVWDYVLLERLHLSADSLRAMLGRSLAADPDFVRQAAAGTVEAWTDDTHAKSRACYLLRGKRMRKGVKVRLDREYVRAATLTEIGQLKLGGVRLACLLNRALDPGSRTAVPVSPGAAAAVGPDTAAFFASAVPIGEGSGVGVGKRAPSVATGRKGASGKRYAWSVNSSIYHFSDCAVVARIHAKNLRTGNEPPKGKRLHAGCPVKR